MDTWYVLGAGSMGRLFARRLAAAGMNVVLLRRDTPAPAMPPRLLLVATKAPDAVAALERHVAGDGQGQLALLLQNGMGTQEAVRMRWPRLRLWNAVTTAAAWRDEHDALHVVTAGETLTGRQDDAGDPAPDAAIRTLADAGILAHADDIRAVLWRKLAVNALVNPLTALHGCRNGELETLPAARDLLAPLATEIDAVARAEGVLLDTLALGHEVLHRTAGNFSSMNRDLAHGRRTEIDFITGYVVACARRHGIDVPLNRQLLNAVRAHGGKT